MTHQHTAATVRRLPGANQLSQCKCGARKMSDDSPIYGGTLDGNGWYTETPVDDSRRAYDLLQNEGYEPETDRPDPLDSHMPNID